MKWPVERSDPTGEPVPNAEVCGLPRNLLTESDQTRRDASHRSFVRPRSRSDVKINFPRQIKTDFRRALIDVKKSITGMDDSPV